MSKYARNRLGVWHLGVRTRGTREHWSVTGPAYYFNREDCKKDCDASSIEHPTCEYKPLYYLPAKFPRK
jgi:hypothetical protein